MRVACVPYAANNKASCTARHASHNNNEHRHNKKLTYPYKHGRDILRRKTNPLSKKGRKISFHIFYPLKYAEYA